MNPFFQWGVFCHSIWATGGFVDTYDEALANCLKYEAWFTAEGRSVAGYFIYDEKDTCLLHVTMGGPDNA